MEDLFNRIVSMGDERKTLWAERYFANTGKIYDYGSHLFLGSKEKPTFLKMAVDTGLKLGGGALMFGGGYFIGEQVENIPYLTTVISHLPSPINSNGEMYFGEILGLVTGAYGVKESKLNLDKELLPKSISFGIKSLEAKLN